uniref:Uncharacterized protein n=1 Tax=Arundo donax TaxID=35708 RepID=A0A0A9GBP8_ARUDO
MHSQTPHVETNFLDAFFLFTALIISTFQDHKMRNHMYFPISQNEKFTPYLQHLLFLLVGRGAEPLKQHGKEPSEIDSLLGFIFLHLSVCFFRLLSFR